MTLVSYDEATSLDRFASFDLDTLVGGAVRLRADRIALADSVGGTGESLSFAEFDRRASALAGFWLELGLKPGERILVVGGAVATSVVALIAALRAGLDVAFAPLHLSAEEMVDFARDTEAAALAAGAAYGELAPAEQLLTVAAHAPRVRLVCSLGGGRVDGAADADPKTLTARAQVRPSTRLGECHILTRTQNGDVVVHRQQTLIAAALDLVTRARIGMRLPIIATIAPVTFAGLVAGPVTALLAGAPLLLHGPFTAASFTSLIERAGPSHLVVPTAMTPALQRAGLLDTEKLASLILVSRCDKLSEPPTALPAKHSGHAAGEVRLPPIVDVFAIGEYAAVPEMRGRNGNCLPPLAEPHYIFLDDQRILAVGRSANSALEGAAVTEVALPRTDEPPPI